MSMSVNRVYEVWVGTGPYADRDLFLVQADSAKNASAAARRKAAAIGVRWTGVETRRRKDVAL